MTDEEIAHILDLAQSEVKRWGGTEPTLTHVAYVFTRLWTVEVNEEVGTAFEGVEARLRERRFGGDEAAVRTLLRGAANRRAAIRALQEALGGEAETATGSVSGTDSSVTSPAGAAHIAPQPESTPADSHEAWLVRLVEERLALFDASDDDSLLDDLFILVASLRVSGYDASYARLRTRLETVRGGEPASSPAGASVLSSRTARFARRVLPSTGALCRPSESAEVAAQLLRPDAPLVAIIGEEGVGRTALLGEIAAQLAQTENALPLWRLGADTVVANANASLKMALEDAEGPAVIVIDDLDRLADLGTADPDRVLLKTVADARDHPELRIVVVIDRRYASRIAVINRSLDDAMVKVPLNALPHADLERVTCAAVERQAADLGVELGDGLVAAALAPASAKETLAHPGLAIARVDAAIGRARLARSPRVGAEHLAITGATMPVQADTRDLRDALRARVRGQDHCVERVAERLALTRAGLDLRPHRPNGVFLFAGPTGVGKTELAHQIAIAEYGGSDRLIRLDMSEYADDQMAKARLVGSAPGYVGYTEPEGWLTTRVAQNPRSVILLDEIEKAHPAVWNIFLQVFDAGRLTDGRGMTVSFSDTVIILTSNLGAREASAGPVGFGEQEDRGRQRQLTVIHDVMAPELLNRFDDVIIFNTLSMEAIIEIAEVELSAAVQRLGASGWALTYAADVPRWLAETGYDPGFGARHLQRNIEREFLGLLARSDQRTLHVVTAGDELAIAP